MNCIFFPPTLSWAVIFCVCAPFCFWNVWQEFHTLIKGSGLSGLLWWNTVRNIKKKNSSLSSLLEAVFLFASLYSSFSCLIPLFLSLSHSLFHCPWRSPVYHRWNHLETCRFERDALRYLLGIFGQEFWTEAQRRTSFIMKLFGAQNDKFRWICNGAGDRLLWPQQPMSLLLKI